MKSPSPRPTITALTAYRRAPVQPGIDLYLDGNEGPLPANEPLLRRYPDVSALQQALAARHGHDPAGIAIGAGADELLDRLCRAFLGPGDVCLAPAPCFAMLPRYVGLAGATLRAVPWPHGPFPRQALLAAAGPTVKVVVLTSPNNPTGAVATDDDLLAIARALPTTLLVCDLAYVEFAERDPTMALRTLPNIVVLRTFSKAFALAGLRVGYALGAPDVLAAVRVAGSPYPVAAPSLRAAAAALAVGPDPRLLARIADERRLLARLLRERGFTVPDSEANFVFAVAKTAAAARTLVSALAAHGIAIRTFDDAALAAAVRITCPGDAAACARLTAALAWLPVEAP